MVGSEKWVDIKGYEGLYQISDRGRVKSLDRKIVYKDGSVHSWKGQIIKKHISNVGYERVTLYTKGKSKKISVHRLVAEHFIDKIKGKNIINHLDCDRLNNNVDNLEWTTHKDNSKYMVEKNRNKKGIEVRRQKLGKKITGISPEGEIVFFDSYGQARKKGYYHKQIRECCELKRETYKGYVWRYVGKEAIQWS